ncbi:MAG: hypothetical protein WBQ83_19045, partial [Candidatus Acidiferrales bacterium]
MTGPERARSVPHKLQACKECDQRDSHSEIPGGKLSGERAAEKYARNSTNKKLPKNRRVYGAKFPMKRTPDYCQYEPEHNV